MGFTVATNSWGVERHNQLMASRIMLNIHQDMFQYIEPLRMVLAAAYGLPVLTELIPPDNIQRQYCTVLTTPLYWNDPNYFHESVKTMLDQYEHYYNLGLQFREFMTSNDNTFKALLEKYI